MVILIYAIIESSVYGIMYAPKCRVIIQIISLSFCVTLMFKVPFLLVFTPFLSAENKAEKRAETVIMEDFNDKREMSILFTDSNYNYVIYPAQAKTCRVQIYKPFPKPQDVKNIGTQQESESSGKINCFSFSDKLKNNICDRFKGGYNKVIFTPTDYYNSAKKAYCGDPIK